MCSGLPRELGASTFGLGERITFFLWASSEENTGFGPQSGLEFPPADNKAPQEHLDRMNRRKKSQQSKQ